MTDNNTPRTISYDEVQAGDRIRIEGDQKDITYSRTLTVVTAEGRFLITPEDAHVYIFPDETVTLLDRPEPEPEWVADGICVDAAGFPWMLHEGEWFNQESEGCSAYDLQLDFGPVTRHPAVIAAEKRGEQRVLDAVREVLKPGRHCDSLAAAQDLVDGWAS